MTEKKKKTGYEGMDMTIPGPNDMVPNSRNPEYKGGGAREVLCYVQPLATVMDFGAPQSPLGSESPSSAMFIANKGKGNVASPGAKGRDTAKDDQLMTYQPRRAVKFPPGIDACFDGKEDRR